MNFDVGKVTQSLWPEVGGVMALFGAKAVARYVDETYALTKIGRRTQDYVDAAAVVIPTYLIGTGSKATESSEAVLFTMAGIYGQRLADGIYGKVIGKKAIGHGKIKGNPGGGVIGQAERAKQIAQANANALVLATRTKQPAAVGGYTEF